MPFQSGAQRELTHRIIGAAIEVHRIVGPGLLESTYEECLCRELRLAELPFLRQVHVPLVYKGETVSSAHYRLDLLVDKAVVVEVKAIDQLAMIHKAQMLTYLRHTGVTVGLILNFNTSVLHDGIVRVSL